MILIGAMAVSAGVVQAAEWWPVGGASSSVWFIDRPSIKTVSRSKIFWARREFKQGSENGEAKYVLIKWAAHCNSNTIQILAFLDYTASGTVIASVSKPAAADEIAPDSIGESMYKILCDGKEWPSKRPTSDPAGFTETYFSVKEQIGKQP
ncbi:surface-adhesin E family protein [Vogesella indigofera]|uniref:surface-adhesin E family protein n=1 Tax=Vogesella indigofera TaxID=45465 RepID=UPI003570FC46